MKILSTSLFILWYLFGSAQVPIVEGNSEDLVSKGLKLINFEKAQIIYSVDGQPGDSLILQTDRYGWRQVTREFGEKTYYGLKTQIDTREVVDGEVIITLNLKDGKGKTGKDFTLPKLAAYKSPPELFEAQMAKLGAQLTGSEQLLDRDCQVWTYETRGKQYKLWAWEGLILKHISPNQTKTAISIDLNPSINEELFLIPKEITLAPE